MKYAGWIFGILLVAGAAYAGYYYGSGQLQPPADAGEEQQSDDISPDESDADLDTSDDTPTNQDSIGPTAVRITSPANGAVITADNGFTVAGTVSNNAKQVRVIVYEQNYYGYGVDSLPSETKIDDYILNGFQLGDTAWVYKVGHEFKNLSFGSIGARFVVRATYTDNTTKEAQTSVTYTFETAEMGKPVVYLYPEKPTWVSVNVLPTSGISVSEPAINDGWRVLANPDGRLINSDGTAWPYLFWEGFAADFVTPKEGFVIARAEVPTFFDTKLAVLGMNQQEIADFKEFWVPRMQEKSYYFISFIEQATFDRYAPLTVSPTPNTVIRVFFDHQGLDAPIAVPEQKLTPAPEREGFVVIEWGGRLYR